jgi:membrane protease YdiL (CAAX protease family)
MEQNRKFPNIWSALLILAILSGLQFLIAVIMYSFGVRFESGDPEIAAVVTVLSSGVVFSFLMSYKKLSYKSLFHFSSNSVNSTVIVLTVPIVLTTGGAVFWITDLTNLVILYYPMPDKEYQMFTHFLDGGIITIAMSCLIAPFVEEILFRGIFLRSFLANYSVRHAIVLSSLLFALYHQNIYQFPVAFLFGSFSGWLYVNTRSLWPSVLAHTSYNSLATLFSYTQPIADKLPEHAVADFNPLWLIVISVVVSALGIVMLSKLFYPPRQQGT